MFVLQPFYRVESSSGEGDFSVTEFAGRINISVTLHNLLTAEEIDAVAEVLERALGGAQ